MHSSRMRIAHLLPVSPSMHWAGVSAPGGVCSRGGVCAPGGCLLPGGVCSWGVSAPGGACSWGVSASELFWVAAYSDLIDLEKPLILVEKIPLNSVALKSHILLFSDSTEMRGYERLG